MDIRWFGQSFFEVVTDTEVEKGVKIYLDPYGGDIGLALPKNLEADVVLVSHSHPDHNNTSLFKEAGLLVDTAGEYSVKGVDIKGILAFHDGAEGKKYGHNVVFSIESEGIKVVHLGDIGHPLTEAQAQKIGTPDILMIPVGGGHSIDGKEATKIIKQLEPKIVIPMHYKIPNLKAELNGIDDFCKEMGICAAEPLKKLSIKAGNLAGKEVEIITMEP